MTITPSVIQSSGCLRRLGSGRTIPSLPCSSSMRRSWELLLWKMEGPVLRRIKPSRNMGCTLVVSLVRLITDLSCRFVVIFSEQSDHEVIGCNPLHLTQKSHPSSFLVPSNAMPFYCCAKNALYFLPKMPCYSKVPWGHDSGAPHTRRHGNSQVLTNTAARLIPKKT